VFDDPIGKSDSVIRRTRRRAYAFRSFEPRRTGRTCALMQERKSGRQKPRRETPSTRPTVSSANRACASRPLPAAPTVRKVPGSYLVHRASLSRGRTFKPGRPRKRAMPAALPILEPGQGLAGIAPEQPIVFAAAGIEYGQGRRDVAAGAAGLLLLDGLALLASVTAFRLLIHVVVALGPALGDLTNHKVSTRS